MTASAAATDRPSGFAIRSLLPKVAGVLALTWVAVVAIRGVLLALNSAGLVTYGDPQLNFATTELIAAAIAVYLSCVLAALGTRAIRPGLEIPITLSVGGL